MKAQDRLHRLIALYQTEQISDEEFAELEAVLRDSQDARDLFHRTCRVDSQLRREAENSEGVEQAPKPKNVISPVFRPLAWLSAAAAVTLTALLTWSYASQPKIIATLVSAEDAAWESSLPTEPGSQLSRGYLKLQSGIATIRFTSGAELVLEAPAKLMLKGPKRAKLNSGAAMLEVPESAIGFVLETPDGYAVDYGTKFAVHVNGKKARSDFEVLAGEISVHHPSSGKEVRLTGNQTASVSENDLITGDSAYQEEAVEQQPALLKIATEGRAATLIRNDKPHKWTRSDMLMCRTANNSSGFDRRVLCGFDLSALDAESIQSVSLRLNQVPSGLGFASRLPQINRFAIYGLTNSAKLNWTVDTPWTDAPDTGDGTLVGTFEIRRSQQTGTIRVDGDELLAFVKDRAGGEITLILVRETTHIEGEGKGLVHAFASDSHPQAAGPVLEVTLKE